MAVTNQEVIFTFNAETGEVEKVTTRLVKDMEKVADAADDAAKATEEIGKNAEKSGGLIKRAAKVGADGFKLLGAAIAATGLLELVRKVLTPIIDAFLENKKVADALGLAMAAIGTVIDTLIDAVTPLVDLLFEAFTNPQAAVEGLKEKLQAVGDYIKTLLNTAFNPIQKTLLGMKRAFLDAAVGAKEFFGGDATELKQAIREVDDQLSDLTKQQEENKEKLAAPFKAAAESVRDFVKQVKEQTTQSIALEKQLQALGDRQRELNVATAQGAAEVEELKRQSDDQRLSVEERIEAATRAAELNQKYADENVAIANERADLLRRELELQGETEERLQAVADAEIEAAAARQASATIQTELQNKLFALNQELIAQEEERLAAAQDELAARQKLEDELYALTLSARERQELALMQEYDERVAIAGDDEGLLRAATEQLNADLAAIDKEYRDKEREEELANAEAIKKARLDITKSTLDALSALNEAFTGESEQEQKKGFERSKKIQTAQALISTYESAVQAFKSLAGIPVVGPGLGTAAAVAATAAGLANVKKIQSQTFQGGGGGGGSSYSGTGGPGPSIADTAAQTPPAPTLDLGFLGEGAQQQVIETYVISENVTNAQQANKKIQDQSTL